MQWCLSYVWHMQFRKRTYSKTTMTLLRVLYECSFKIQFRLEFLRWLLQWSHHLKGNTQWKLTLGQFIIACLERVVKINFRSIIRHRAHAHGLVVNNERWPPARTKIQKRADAKLLIKFAWPNVTRNRCDETRASVTLATWMANSRVGTSKIYGFLKKTQAFYYKWSACATST